MSSTHSLEMYRHLIAINIPEDLASGIKADIDDLAEGIDKIQASLKDLPAGKHGAQTALDLRLDAELHLRPHLRSLVNRLKALHSAMT